MGSSSIKLEYIKPQIDIEKKEEKVVKVENEEKKIIENKTEENNKKEKIETKDKNV